MKTLDTRAMTLTLDDGKLFYLPQGWKDPGVKVGEKVSVTYDRKDGQNMASNVVIQN